MDRIENIDRARERILEDMNTFLSSVRTLAVEEAHDLSTGLSVLRRIRSTVYENLNQIQHEYLILRGLLWISENDLVPQNTQWYWNPRQTGDASEPDLRGTYQDRIILSAEATTSEKPQGIIDKRMRNTLEKLSEMDGEKFYFIRTSTMERRAVTKVTKNGWPISIVKLEG